jgi:hypothetical protein
MILERFPLYKLHRVKVVSGSAQHDKENDAATHQ